MVCLGIANILLKMQLDNIIYKVIVFILRCYVIRDKNKKRKELSRSHIFITKMVHYSTAMVCQRAKRKVVFRESPGPLAILFFSAN